MPILTLGGSDVKVETSRENQPETIRMGYVGICLDLDLGSDLRQWDQDFRQRLREYANSHGFDDFVLGKWHEPSSWMGGHYRTSVDVLFFQQNSLRTIDFTKRTSGRYLEPKVNEVLEHIRRNGDIVEFVSLHDLPRF